MLIRIALPRALKGWSHRGGDGHRAVEMPCFARHEDHSCAYMCTRCLEIDLLDEPGAQ